eukprot:953332-Prymnesium_polylepis.1
MRVEVRGGVTVCSRKRRASGSCMPRCRLIFAPRSRAVSLMQMARCEPASHGRASVLKRPPSCRSGGVVWKKRANSAAIAHGARTSVETQVTWERRDAAARAPSAVRRRALRKTSLGSAAAVAVRIAPHSSRTAEAALCGVDLVDQVDLGARGQLEAHLHREVAPVLALPRVR